MLVRKWPMGNTYILLEGMWISAVTVEISVDFLKKQKTKRRGHCHMIYQSYYYIYSNDTNMLYQRYSCLTMFIAILFTIVKLWNQSSVHHQKNIQRKCEEKFFRYHKIQNKEKKQTNKKRMQFYHLQQSGPKWEPLCSVK